MIYLKSDVFIGIPPRLIQELDWATPEELQDFWIASKGNAMHWDILDASFSILGLVHGIYGRQNWMHGLMAIPSR